MTDSGKPGKPKAGFPPFPPSLESPQKQRASHIPTASTTSPYLKERLSRAGLTAGPKTVISEGGPQQTAEVGQNHLPNAALAPVINYSFSDCEANVPKSWPQMIESYAQKANSEGITWIASSGDSGAAACENQNGTATEATTGLSVNIPASIPEVTGVGGTELAEGTGNYWGTNNGAVGEINRELVGARNRPGH